MSIGKLQNHMRLQALLAASNRVSTRIGIVSSLDSANYCAKVKLQPAGVDTETGWLPIMTAWAGNGWGLMAPPSIGSQVKIDFLEGSVDVGMIAGVLFSTEDMPLDVPAGEFWLVHQSGSSLKFTNDGKVSVTSQSDMNVTAGGNITITSGSSSIQAKPDEIDITATTIRLNGNVIQT